MPDLETSRTGDRLQDRRAASDCGPVRAQERDDALSTALEFRWVTSSHCRLDPDTAGNSRRNPAKRAGKTALLLDVRTKVLLMRIT